MINVFLGNEKIDELEIDLVILKKLNDNSIYTIRDLWNLRRKDLKRFDLKDAEINQIIIKMQLYGIDLNKKIYNKN